MPPCSSINQIIQKNFPTTLESLKKFIAFPGISAKGLQSKALTESADWLSETCRDFGLSTIKKIVLPGSAPYLYAHLPSELANAPKILLYAHYDVQPIGNADLWHSPPFKAMEKNKRLFGRGSADDKAGIFAILGAIQALLESKKPIPAHLNILFDGEEECGSPHMSALLKKHEDLFQADTLIVPDLVNPDLNRPSITFSLRGLIEFKIRISSIKRAVHSGLGGGVIPDPTAVLAKLYANALGKNGEVVIPGVRVPHSSLPRNLAGFLSKIKFSETKLRKDFQLPPSIPFLQNSAKKFFSALWFSPALTLLNLQIAEPGNYANRIQPDIEAVFSLRLAPWQNPKEVGSALRKYFCRSALWGCKVDFEILHDVPGFHTDPQAPYFRRALKAVSKAYGKTAVARGTGLSIPFVPTIQKRLGKMDTILLGVEDPQSNAHAENESVSISMFKNSIVSVANLLEFLSPKS